MASTDIGITSDHERKYSVRSDLVPKVWTTEDLLEMVGTDGWRNYMVIFLSLSCKCISICVCVKLMGHVLIISNLLNIFLTI